MNPGRFELCLKVKDFEASIEFYKILGFNETVDWETAGFASLSNGSLTISLYKNDIECNILNFRGEDVEKIAKTLGIKSEVEADGSVGAWITDPDGNIIYFNTMPED